MKKYFPYILIAIIGVGILFFIFKGKTPDGELAGLKKGEGRLHFKIEELPDDVIAQSGTHQIMRSEIDQSAAMRAFNKKEKDLLFVLVYKQFVSYNDSPPALIEFSIDRLSLSPRNLLDQYKIPFKAQTKTEIKAFDPSEGLARVDGKTVQLADVDFNNFIWAAHESDIFRYKLKDIDKKMKIKVVDAEAMKLQISPSQYRDRYIFEKLPMEVSEKDIQTYLQKYNLEDDSRNRNNAKTRILDMRKRRGVDYILEKYVMDLPILVDLESPAYRLEDKDEFTPSIGGSGLKVTYFGDTRRALSESLLLGLLGLVKRYPSVSFNYRPVFADNDGAQKTISKGHLCVWKNSRKKFWSFFEETLGSFNGDPVKKMTGEVSSAGISSSELSQCLKDPEMGKVIKYHLDYAKYLSIEVGPVLYVGGEVFNGHINMDEVEDAIQRHLNIPAAGIW